MGPCGHRGTCSRCVARLRFVLKDKRCVLCQQDTASVFFTRHMGDYTSRLSAEEFASLKVREGLGRVLMYLSNADGALGLRIWGWLVQPRADKGEVYYAPEVEGYFDDAQHYAEIK